ncbi:MAG: amidohydrolase family protein [Bdellovibrionales bacterium]|nr:amidohydrolase family protein [Bdellovibrionales bacterium]
MKFYRGVILNPKSDTVCEFMPDGVLVVSGPAGRAKIEAVLTWDRAQEKYGKAIRASNTFDFRDSVILPGFFDMHFHWVQDEVRTMPKDSLLQWLEKYTFPAEARFSDPAFAKARAREFFKRLARVGTFGGAIFSSIHDCALSAAMKESKGNFVIGNVLMTMNSPNELTQTEEEAIALTRKLLKKFGKRFAFTPRFAISTSPGVMKEGARLADRAGCFKQSHLSENLQEIDFTLSLYRGLRGFQKVKSYTEIYQSTGMLGSRSLLAHGIHLSRAELRILSRTRTAIIHCPTSNAPISEQGLGSGLFDFKKTERAGVRWALGSDIGGGPVLSMFDVMRSFVEQNARAGVKGASCIKALYRATLAGAEILGVSKQTGNFKKGKDATFLVVSLPGQGKPSQSTDAQSLLARILRTPGLDREAFDRLVQLSLYRGRIAV